MELFKYIADHCCISSIFYAATSGYDDQILCGTTEQGRPACFEILADGLCFGLVSGVECIGATGVWVPELFGGSGDLGLCMASVLVSKRAERHQIGVDVIASGALALAAPGAYWVSVGQYDTTGWWLWGLAWLQSAASIVYAFLRLGQRRLKEMPDQKEKFNLGKRTLLYSGFNFILTLILGLMGKLPNLIWIPFAIQFAESIYGTYYPAIGVKPTRIGIRQLIVSTIFTIVFIIIWQ